MPDPTPAPAPAPIPATVLQNWTPFRSDFPSFVLGTAFSVVSAGKLTKDGAATLTHCAVELELWALGQYFGTKPVVGSFRAEDPAELTDEQAYSLLASQHPVEPGLVGGIFPAITASVAIKLALWLLKTAAGVLL